MHRCVFLVLFHKLSETNDTDVIEVSRVAGEEPSDASRNMFK